MASTLGPPGTTLLAYPNVSEGRDQRAIDAVASAFGPALLDVHSDPDHHRSAFTLAGRPGELAGAVLNGAARALELLTLDCHDGIHPRVGVLDVAPIVYRQPADRGAACVEALVLADRLGSEHALPVFLYGSLAGGRTRAQLRRGGHDALAQRMAAGELRPDFGPGQLHPSAGAVLVAARPPLVAFNVELAAPASREQAREIAARIREGGSEGLAGVRAIGLWLSSRGCAQVSTNIEDPARTSLAAVVAAIARHAAPAGAELVGLAPQRSLDGFPADVPLRGVATIEETLSRHARTA